MKSTAIKAATEVGSFLMKNFGKTHEVSVKDAKDKKSLVTNIDLESEKAIKKIIQSKFPEHNIITEESDKIDNKSPYTWHIDPIDGTHNYLRGTELFGVSIALEFNGEIILGVINLPFLKKLYIAEKGKGAFCNNKKIKVSNKSDLDFARVVLTFDRNVREKTIEFLIKIKSELVDIRGFGCAIYTLASLAQGSIDGYIINKTNSWDVAAGFLLIEEAGGKVTNNKNEKWNIKERDFIASNGKLHDKIISYAK